MLVQALVHVMIIKNKSMIIVDVANMKVVLNGKRLQKLKIVGKKEKMKCLKGVF